MSQAEWEVLKAVKQAVAVRQKMNKEIMHHFGYGAAAGRRTSPLSSPVRGLAALRSPVGPVSPVRGLASPVTRLQSPQGGRGMSQTEYEDRKRGWISSGNWNVRIAEDVSEDLPGGRGIHCWVTHDWNFMTHECATIASRVILAEGKHLFRIKLKEAVVPYGTLAHEGLIKVGFFDKEVKEIHKSWALPEADGKVRPRQAPCAACVSCVMS